MNPITFDSKVTLKEAYLIMFDYLDKYWERTGKPDDIGKLLGELSLSDKAKGKEPMDPAVISDWFYSAKNVLEEEQTADGYRYADIKFLNKK